MKFRFPLIDVEINIEDLKRNVKNPIYKDDFIQLNQNEFSLNISNVGWFYASNGSFVSITPYPPVNKNTIELYLNGSVYGAILHQRKILPLHGSSFIWNRKGILICGDTGAGKSSLTASFCFDGAEFLTDDVTPIILANNKPLIWALSDRIKLWEDSLSQLNLEKKGLKRIDPTIEKFYYPFKSRKPDIFNLDHIVILEKSEKTDIIFDEISGAGRFAALRNEVYRWEYLQGMSQSELVYFRQLLNISQFVYLTKVSRPEKETIVRLKTALQKYFSTQNGIKKVVSE